MQEASSALSLTCSRLLGARNPDGGWGSRPGVPSDTESTALSVMALTRAAGPRDPPRTGGPVPPASVGTAASQEEHGAAARAVAAGVRWLASHQRPDGAWPASEQAPQGSWMTGLAVLGLRGREDHVAATARGREWLIQQRGKGAGWKDRLLQRLLPENRRTLTARELDPNLTGWPWTSGSFGWIEPTAYGILALKSFRDRGTTRSLGERIRMGEQMLLHNTCRGGGWNHGSPTVLGKDLWPYPDTTAWALMALQDVQASPQVLQGLALLPALLEENSSRLALATAILALELHRWRQEGAGEAVQPEEELRERLQGRAATGSMLDETRVLALTALALGTGDSPLRVPSDG